MYKKQQKYIQECAIYHLVMSGYDFPVTKSFGAANVQFRNTKTFCENTNGEVGLPQ